MGWRELMGWVNAMRRQLEGGKRDPESWEDPVSARNFAELDEVRRKIRGR